MPPSTPQSIDWSDVQDAIYTWVKEASGLGEDQVVWADQEGPQPEYPYIEIRLGGLVPVGGPDPVYSNTDLEREEGEEVELYTIGLRELPVFVQAYTETTVEDVTAMSILSPVQSKLVLPSFKSPLRAAGLSPFDRGRILNLSALFGADFEGRATLEVRFYVSESVSERTGYIAQAAATGTYNP